MIVFHVEMIAIVVFFDTAFPVMAGVDVNSVVENMVEAFGDFQSILLASNEELDAVEGIGPARVSQITLGLERIRSQIITDSNWVQ